VLEAIQQAANPGINTTIKDKYFNSASANPATIFPILNNLAQKHLKKLDTGLRIHYDRQLGQIKELLGETLPGRLSLPEQASFDLGYYPRHKSDTVIKEEN
jgi:CRISPR-associated protein Csd1